MEIKQQMEDNERSLADNRKRLNHWSDRRAKLRLHELDDLDEEDKEDDAEDAPVELVDYPEEELRAIDQESIKAEIVVYEGECPSGLDWVEADDIRSRRTFVEGPREPVYLGRVPQARARFPEAGPRSRSHNAGPRPSKGGIRYPSKRALRTFHGRVQHHFIKAQRNVSDDNARWKRRAGACRQPGSFQRRDHLQRHAPKEELEEYQQSLWRREDIEQLGFSLRSACFQANPALRHVSQSESGTRLK